MYHNLQIPEKCLSLWQECQDLVPALIKDCTSKAEDVRIYTGHPIKPEDKSVFLVTDGEVYETYEGQLIVIYEKGDLINADSMLHNKVTRYETDFAATVREYDGQQFIDAIFADKSKIQIWSRYLSCLSQSYQLLTSHFSRQDTELLPEFRQYKKGETIIEENTEGDEVFTLLNGTAKVISNNEEVGEIKHDEIFGAIAALTNTMRTATIVATSDCDTLVAKSENFRGLVATRPDIVQKLIHDMARTIVSSNERIIELSKDKN